MEESSTSLMRVHGVRGAIDEEDAIRRLIAAAVPSNTATVEEVEDDDDDAASCGGEIQLGFVESVDPGEEYIFLPEYFPSKAWLDLYNVPEATNPDVICPWCNCPMPLLLQVYCPLEQFPHAYHRMLYVFACKKGECHHHDSTTRLPMCVLRSQLPSDDPLYSRLSADSDGEEEEEEEEEEGEESREKSRKDVLATFEEPVHCCYVCGYRGVSRCVQCGELRYCSREHQRIDWRHGHDMECTVLKSLRDERDSQRAPSEPPHQTDGEARAPLVKKRKCRKDRPRRACGVLFREMEIVTEEEPAWVRPNTFGRDDDVEAEDKEIEEQNSELLAMYRKKLRAYRNENLTDEDFQHLKEKEDLRFTHLQRIVKPYPDQVLRYYHSEDHEVLWATERDILSADDVPPCRHCGGPSRLELQVMPQLLHFLRLERKDGGSTPDWAMLVVYTCKASCIEGGKYGLEFVWRQQFKGGAPS